MKPNMIPCDPSEAVLAVCNGVELKRGLGEMFPWELSSKGINAAFSDCDLHVLNATFYKPKPEPVPPKGYRLATEEDRKGPKPKALIWHKNTSEWFPNE